MISYYRWLDNAIQTDKPYLAIFPVTSSLKYRYLGPFLLTQINFNPSMENMDGK